jgi:hypothetical protein
MAEAAQWESIHTADLVAASACLDERIGKHRMISRKLSRFLKEIASIKRFLTASNAIFFRKAVEIASGDKDAHLLEQLVQECLRKNHVEASTTVTLITMELLLEIRAEISDFIY